MAKKTNFEVNGSKYYRVTRTVGHKADGTPIRKTFYGTGINEANEKADEYMNKLKNGYSIDFDKVTVAQALDKWLFTIKIMQVRPSTFVSYESNFRNYIKNSIIGGMEVSKVKLFHVQEYYNQLYSKGNSTQKIKMIQKLLHNFFEYAYIEGYVVKNPCHKVVIPKNTLIKHENKDIDIYSPEEISCIRKAFKGHKYESIIYTAIYTGMRSGEIYALKWKNVNLDEGYIKVEESIKDIVVFNPDRTKSTQLVTTDGKTQNSIRTVYLPDILINKLKELQRGKDNDYVFTEDGHHIRHKQVFREWNIVLKENNIPYKKFHALRHTYASMLLLNGADLKSVQELMGHYDMKITQIYLHSLPENKKRIANILDNI